MPEKGFTATFISNSGRVLRQFDISGWKLVIFRVLLALVVLLVSTAAVVVAYGFINSGETGRLRQEISLLEDSLARRNSIEARLDNLETRLQYLYGYQKKIENIAGFISGPDDSLEQQ